MSRIGKQPIAIPDKVKVTVTKGTIVVEGPKGKLEHRHHSSVSVKVENTNVVVERPDDAKESRSVHGLTRSLVQNMVHGVSHGYEMSLDITGVGYRAELQGNKLTVSAGLSNPVVHQLSPMVTAEVAEKQTRIILRSIDKQALGAEAAKLRSYRPPEPYKGKGIKYTHEKIKRKAGKTGAG